VTSHDLSAQQHLATLRWLLLSPPLVVAPVSLLAGAPSAQTPLASFTPSERSSIALWLEALQQDNTVLIEWLHTRPQARIGRYAENLLEFYLTHGPQHCLAAAHVPLRSEVNGTVVTRGELDFLLTNAQGQRMHWELAVKFFLCTATGDTATPADFIGPNGVETLAHKWHKLFAKQLTHSPPAPWNAHTWQPQALTRGWMFYRWGTAVPQCAALHADHCKGWWTDWADIEQLPQASYVYLPRLQWMAPVKSLAQSGANTPLYTRSSMAQHLTNLWATTERRTDAQLIVQLDDETHTHEVQRFFIRPQQCV
jgi:uncharacterized protein